jgi:hypothetical protein
MFSELIFQAAELMREQAADYRKLNSSCEQLVASLVRGAPSQIEAQTRTSEAQLLRMRARFVKVMAALSTFADSRAQGPESRNISPEAREAFETASNEMLKEAHNFQRLQKRAMALCSGGSTFTTASIEMCGVQPITYRAPYARKGETSGWA